MKCLTVFTALAAVRPRVAAFGRAPHARPRTNLPSAVEAPSAGSELSARASKLKQVLEKEYITFFDPMVTSWYAPEVSFRDPMTSLSGVDSYQNNVDMLAGRTLMGKVLFEGAGIILHSVTGGEIVERNGEVAVDDIITRWTLRVTAKVLPWTPEAVFSGISVYKVQPGGPEGLQIVGQTDFWDSINIAEGTDSLNAKEQYQEVPKPTAVQHFLDQLKPEGFVAPSAAVEVPYVLLRAGDGYEIRRYPGFVGAQTTYERRDVGYGSLGAFSKGMDPLAPSICRVYNDEDSAEPREKTMTWPLRYAAPGSGREAPEAPPEAAAKAGDGQWRTVRLVPQPETVVAVRSFEDFAMAPVVRKADRELREMLRRDGLVAEEGSGDFVRFCQYDAVHSMGKRRSEVWIDLKDGGHPY